MSFNLQNTVLSENRIRGADPPLVQSKPNGSKPRGMNLVNNNFEKEKKP